MRPRRLIVVVAAAASAACGAFSTAEVPGDAGASSADGSADVSVDAGDGGVGNPVLDESGDGAPSGSHCAPHAPINLLSGNFDGPLNGGATYSIMGTPYMIPPNTAGAAAGVMSPGANATAKSLHIHSNGGDYVLEAPAIDVTGGVCVVTSTFDILFESIVSSASGPDTALAVVGVQNPAFNRCSVSFQYFRSTNHLGLQSHCGTRDGGGDYSASTMPLPALPTGFVHVVLKLDLANAVATLSVDASTSVTLPLLTDQIVVGGSQAYAEIGLAGTGAGFDGTIDVDSIDFEAR